jgi:hypothetical protein
MQDTDHFVQFYESDDYLIDSLSEFVAAALNQGDSSVVIATADHRDALQQKLSACGVDIASATVNGRFLLFDAEDTLSKFMVDGSPDAQRFNDTIGGVVAQLIENGHRVHAFGEMVALLWAQGNQGAAIRLEEFWNEHVAPDRMALYCAYPLAAFDQDGQSAAFHGICDCHTRVIPAESYAAIPDPDQRLRAITLLQQKARSLETEIKHLKAAEVAHSDR